MSTAVVRITYTKSIEISDEQTKALDTLGLATCLAVEDEIYYRAIEAILEDGMDSGREEEIVEVLGK